MVVKRIGKLSANLLWKLLYKRGGLGALDWWIGGH